MRVVVGVCAGRDRELAALERRWSARNLSKPRRRAELNAPLRRTRRTGRNPRGCGWRLTGHARRGSSGHHPPSSCAESQMPARTPPASHTSTRRIRPPRSDPQPPSLQAPPRFGEPTMNNETDPSSGARQGTSLGWRRSESRRDIDPPHAVTVACVRALPWRSRRIGVPGRLPRSFGRSMPPPRHRLWTRRTHQTTLRSARCQAFARQRYSPEASAYTSYVQAAAWDLKFSAAQDSVRPAREGLPRGRNRLSVVCAKAPAVLSIDVAVDLVLPRSASPSHI